MYRYNGGGRTGLGNPLSDLWNRIVGGIKITPPRVELPPIQIPGTTPPASAPPADFGAGSSGTPSWLLPAVGIAVVALIALPKITRGRR